MFDAAKKEPRQWDNIINAYASARDIPDFLKKLNGLGIVVSRVND
jgi:hypothetical protein